MLLLYPVIFLTGLVVGLVIGLKQAPKTTNTANTTNTQRTNTSIVPNTNSTIVINSVPTNSADNLNALFANANSAQQNANVANTNTANANTIFNVNTVNTNNGNANGNTNRTIGDGEYLQLDAATLAQFDQLKISTKKALVDQSLPLEDIQRQQDLIDLKYDLKAYYALHQAYPSTSGKLYRLDRSSKDPLYQAMKLFYGSGYNEHIDPQSPTYYYGYTSDGKTFELTCYIVSQKKAFILHDTP